jgi:hypothetical protein
MASKFSTVHEVLSGAGNAHANKNSALKQDHHETKCLFTIIRYPVRVE